MKNIKSIRKKWAILSITAIMALATPLVSFFNAMAETGVAFTVSPMKEKMVLNPGDEYSSTIELYIPDKYENDIKYNVEVAPFFVNDNYDKDFDNTYGINNEIVKWITIDVPTEGRLSPGQTAVIPYTINVPDDAPGGGQYAAIMIAANAWYDKDSGENSGDDKEDEINTGVTEVKKIAHTIYAEITGDVVRQGEITDVNVPGFMLSGNITGTSSIKNTGNVHGEAKYKLQVFPLFSGEEIYTNEEDPQDRTILPDRTLYNETTWDQTPGIGIFNVVYTVEFEGVTQQVSKMVIKCPIWLLFIIIFIIVAIIIYFIVRAKNRGKKSRKTAE
ncbi:hypothetical protein IJG04_03460 [Candidatus Saccharibacteria bacterium]|nr:hypothetical protein [Candidatus Saccharibacteria bacterium]